MFKRSVQISVVKDKKSKSDTPAPEQIIAEKVVYTAPVIKDLVKESMKIIALYVAMDTGRKMLINLGRK